MRWLWRSRLLQRLQAREVITLCGPGDAVLATVGPYQTAVPGSDGTGAWAVVDYRADAAGEVLRAQDVLEVGELLIDRLGWGPVRRWVAAEDHAELFPLGSSLEWPPKPLASWTPPATWPAHRAAG